MKRFILVLATLILTGLLALGTFVAFAGHSPVGGDRGDPPDFAEDHPGNPPADPSQQGEAEGQGQEGELGEGAQRIAQAIADSFGVEEQRVLDMHADGIGFGAIVKLLLLEAAGEPVDLSALGSEGGDAGFAFGERLRDADIPDGLPTNLGQIVSGANANGAGAQGRALGHEHASEAPGQAPSATP
ncbi:MAG: hypothetical protein HYS09_03295 [Chloroflexi bacterium]|nr:hypothetical protein [Chloroflexota bacterium]